MQKFNIVVVGEKACGKTRLIRAFMNKYISSQYIATIGTDLFQVNFAYERRTKRVHRVSNPMSTPGADMYTVNVYDTAGDSRFRSIANSYVNQANVFVICFDKDPETMHTWLEYINERFGKHEVPILIVSTKMDLKSEAELKTTMTKYHLDFSKKYKQSFLFFQTNSTTPEVVDNIFEAALREYIRFNNGTERTLLLNTSRETVISTHYCWCL